MHVDFPNLLTENVYFGDGVIGEAQERGETEDVKKLMQLLKIKNNISEI